MFLQILHYIILSILMLTAVSILYLSFKLQSNCQKINNTSFSLKSFIKSITMKLTFPKKANWTSSKLNEEQIMSNIKSSSSSFYEFSNNIFTPKGLSTSSTSSTNPINGQGVTLCQGRHSFIKLSCYFTEKSTSIKESELILSVDKIANNDKFSISKILRETHLLYKLKPHENIIKILSHKTTPVMSYFTTAFAQRGSLKDVLQKYTFVSTDYILPEGEPILSQNLSFLKIFKICLGISNGLQHLSTNNILHGDICARNIFLMEDFTPKIGDFGSAFRIEEQNKIQREFVIEWTCIQILLYRSYSLAADIWSYGVLLWEIFSHGNTPYQDLTDNILVSLANGYRLQTPPDTPIIIESIMSSCWNFEPTQRNSFDNISSKLVDCIQQQQLKTYASIY